MCDECGVLTVYDPAQGNDRCPVCKKLHGDQQYIGNTCPSCERAGNWDCDYGFKFDSEKKLIDWVIVGGESGPNARPMHPDWARSLRDQCKAAGRPFLFKQWGAWICADQDECPHGPPISRWMWADGAAIKFGDGDRAMPLFCRAGKKAAGRLLDGREWNGVPI